MEALLFIAGVVLNQVIVYFNACYLEANGWFESYTEPPLFLWVILVGLFGWLSFLATPLYVAGLLLSFWHYDWKDSISFKRLGRINIVKRLAYRAARQKSKEIGE